MRAYPEEFFVRKEKVEKLRQLGIEPYPYKFNVTHHSAEIKEQFDKLQGKEVSVAGRIMTKRVFGKLNFAHLRDEYGDIQIVTQKGVTSVSDLPGEDGSKFFKKFIDTGDIIGVRGEVIKTKTGEISVLAKELKILSKALLPLPEKWHGLQDKELRYRERYLDLIVNPESRRVFKTRNRIISFIREFLNDRGFLEMETPVLQPIYGGAMAKPFETYSHVLGTKLYLRISNELYLKRLLVGGFEKVYEFSKDFRNEGIDRLHYPEFTLLEAYAAYWDYEDMLRMTEELLSQLALEIKGSFEFEYQGEKISFKPPFERIDYVRSLEKHLGFNPLEVDEEKLRKAAETHGIEKFEKLPKHKLMDKLFDKIIGDKIKDPAFVINHPVEISPLAKRHREIPGVTERFELFILGMEIANAFSELNDPIDQRQRFEKQVELRKLGDAEIPAEIDEDFLKALEVGMPPAGGIGYGIDRIVMLLTDQPSIRDVILFPQLRPKKE